MPTATWQPTEGSEQESSELLAQLIGCAQSVSHIGRGHLEGHVAHGLVRTAGMLADLEQILLAGLTDADLLQGGGQTHAPEEVVDLAGLLQGPILKDQLGQGTEGHLFAVQHGVGALQGGHSVMNGVGCSQAGALEAQTAQQGIGLDDLLKSGCAHTGLGSGHGLDPILQQGVAAETGQGEGGHGGVPPGHGHRVRLDAGGRLIVGGEGIAQP